MRKALIVGIDHYDKGSTLHGCVNDARAVNNVLERHGDGSVNFDVELMTAFDARSSITRARLKDAIVKLFDDDNDTAAFYFAGHGHIESAGGYLLASDSTRGDEGVALSEILSFANQSKAKNRIIILDSCHSGIAGTAPIATAQSTAWLAEGITILTASTQDQYASEENGSGVFTTLLVDALGGAAANLLGEITPGSIYAHIDRSLGRWEQRPVFKTNVKQFISLRNTEPAIPLAELRRIIEFFPKSGFEFQLDPSFEPEMKGRDEGMAPPILENTLKFAILQKYNRANLVVPVDVPHMWTAAMKSKCCKLTVLGEHYRRLRAKNRF